MSQKVLVLLPGIVKIKKVRKRKAKSVCAYACVSMSHRRGWVSEIESCRAAAAQWLSERK